MKMDDKMYLTATAQGEVKVTGGRAEEKLGARLQRIGKEFGFFGVLSIFYGVSASFCLFRNPLGITVPLFVAVTYGAAFLIFRKMGVPIKKDSYLLAAVSLLIGLSACFTGNMAVGYYMNRLALILLFCIFILHQCHQDNKWNIGKYMASIVLYLAQAVGMVLYPFRHLGEYILSLKDKRSRNVFRLLAGACAAVPAVIFLCVLLSGADMVFRNMLSVVISKFLNPVTLFMVVIQTVFWSLAMYCLVCSAYGGSISDGMVNVRRHSPVAAVSFMAMVGLVYLVFCVIQIVYLFMGKGSLPEGMTYSQYARQGFFQLLFVAVLNLVMVLMCLKYFREHVLLNGFLLLVSLCTYVMLASAVYRMVLYVQQYQLTFLRILVLWFLAMLFVLMAGVVILIFNHEFPLFRFCLAVVSSFYLVFAWMRPDYITARYNVAHRDSIAGVEQSDFMRLSTDAAPALEGMEDSEIKERLLSWYAKRYEVWDDGNPMGLRTFNFSVLKARNKL